MAATTLTSSLVVRLIDQVTGPARNASKALFGLNDATKGNLGNRLSGALERNRQALDATRGGLIDAMAGFYALKTAIGAPIRSAVDFESAMADIAKVSGFDTKGLDEYGRRLRELAVTDIPLAVSDLAALSAAAAQAGVPDEDLFDFTRLVAKAAVAWEMSGAEAGEALAKIRTALGLTNDQTAAYADAVNFVADSLATNAPQLLDFTKRVAVQGEFFGFAKEETLAFGAAMISAGFESEVAATSFRNMGKALARGASATKAQRGAWKKLGLDSVKVAKAMQDDAVGTTIKVIERLGQLPEHMQASVMSDLFGDEARALTPLLKNTELLQKALSLTAQEQRYLNSVGKEFAIRAATSAYKLQRFKSQLNDIALTVGGAILPGLTSLTSALGPIVMKLSDFAEAHPKLISNIIAATAAVVGFKVAVASLRFIGLMGRGGVLSIMALGFNTLGRAIIGATTAARSATALQATLAAMSGAKYTGMAKFADALKGIALAIPGVSGIAGALGAVGSALATISLPAWGFIAAGVTAVAAAGALMWKYWDRISSVVSGVARAVGEQLQPVFEHFKPALDPIKIAISGIGDAFQYAGEKITQFSNWIGSFFEREVLTDAQAAKFEEAGYRVATMMIEAIKKAFNGLLDWFKSLPSKIVTAIGSIDLSGLIKPISLKSIFGGGSAETPANDNSGASSSGVSGHRKRGGPVWPGGSFLVGEEEPEVFTPKTGGDITPLSDLAGAGGRASSSTNQRSMERPVSNIGPITIDIHVNGANDPRDTARLVRDTLREEMRDALEGLHADMGAR